MRRVSAPDMHQRFELQSPGPLKCRSDKAKNFKILAITTSTNKLVVGRLLYQLQRANKSRDVLA
jgi:hypothetical protein